MKNLKTYFIFIFVLVSSTRIVNAQTTGGPDGFGYIWRDSNDPNGPVYNWIDITTLPGSIQTTGLMDDNTIGPFPIGFLFSFYSSFENQIRIGSNGYIIFDNTALAAPFALIPNQMVPNNFIAPFATDLTFADGVNMPIPSAACWYWTSPGSDSLVVSWISVPFWNQMVPNYSGTNTFQVILTNQGDITFQYKEQVDTSGIGPADYCSVGIEDISGINGLSRFHDAYPDTAYAVTFNRPPGNRVVGFCFYDLNQNGLKDSSENGVYNVLVNSTGSLSSFSNLSQLNGYFANWADTGSIQTSVQNVKYYTSTPLSHASNFTAYNSTDSVNFALVPIPGIQDLVISLFPLNNARPGFTVTYRMNFSNVGTTTESGLIYLVHDNRITYFASTDSVQAFYGDTLEFVYQNLSPGGSGIIDVVFSIPPPPVVNIGDVLSSGCVINPVVSDSFPPDNSSSIRQTVVGSFDPNDKTMTGGTSITPVQVASGDYLDYLIRFQNTGTDTAFAIIIFDTLSSSLDLTSFSMVSASHPYTLEIKNGNILKWKFESLMLPDSNANEPGSHGYICYRIKPLTTLITGTVIENRAFIYFDFNLPVITNTAQTIVSLNNQVHEIVKNILRPEIYPNPNNGTFTIYFNQNINKGKITILNLVGEVVFSENTDGMQNKGINFKCESGIYIVRIATDIEVYNYKIVIQ